MPRPAKNVLFSKKDVGARIRTVRQQRGMTQVELAKALAITQSNVSAIERGARSLTVHQVVKLAKALRVTTDEILSAEKGINKTEDGFFKDRRFLRRLKKIQRLSTRDKQVLLRSLDAFLKGAGVD